MSQAEAMFTCPHCGEPTAVTAGDLCPRCTACGEEFSLPADDLEAPVSDARDDELDGLRVRQVATSRRAAIRTQTYFYVLAIGGVAGAVQCLFKAQPPGAMRGLMLGWALLLVSLAGTFFRKARAIARELKKPLLPEPAVPPDFSQLGDGSQIAKHLEEM